MSIKFRCGADPECFLVDKQGKLISAIGYINASKWEPLQIPDMAPGFTLQEDNVAVEYGIPPASSAQEFAANIQAVMDKSKEWFPALSFSKLSCAVFDEDQMHHPNAHVFGCEPDYNAWTFKPNRMPRPGKENMRSAGGHVHIETKEDHIQVVRAMDVFAGIPSVLMDNGEERKQMYGKRGAFRSKSYGPEYRTLSNFWIFDKKYVEWLWRATERALGNLGLADEFAAEIEQAIDFNNKDVAKKLVDQLNLEVV